MPFDYLLSESLVPGKTVAEDRNRKCRTSAKLDRAGDETVLVFRIDDDGTRRRLGLIGKKCCDALFFLKNASNCMLIFVELKSGDMAEAKEQILSAVRAIAEKSKPVESRAIDVHAVIVMNQVSSHDRRRQDEIRAEMRRSRIVTWFAVSRGGPCDLRRVIEDLKK